MKTKDHDIIKQLKKRNEKALEYVVREYGGIMKTVIQRILYSYPEDAEECLYDSVLKIWNHIDSFDPEKSTFSNWAAAVAKYSALDRLRKLSKIKPLLDIDEMQLCGSGITSDETFNDFFCELISCLSDEDKELFIRLFWYGESYDEISFKTKKNKSILFNRVSRGKKRIMQCNPELFRKR